MTAFALPPRKTECPDCGRTKIAAASITTTGASLYCVACGSTFDARDGGDGFVEDCAGMENSTEATAPRSPIRPSAWSRGNLTRATTVAIALSLSASCTEPPALAVRRA